MEAEYSITVPILQEVYDTNQKQQQFVDDQTNNTGETSFIKTCLNCINALCGIGILSVPYALASGGWVCLILLFVLATCTFYAGLLIKKCIDIDPKNITTYTDIAKIAFGNRGRWIISLFMNLELYFIATGFLILEGDNLHKLLPHVLSHTFVILVALVIILPTVWIDNLTILSYISATGILASGIILASVLWTGLGFHGSGGDRVILNPKGIPTALSLYVYSYCGHPVFPTLYTSMKDRTQFSKVLFIAFSISTICYASIAVLGYLMFGSSLQSQITLNLPTDRISSRIAIYTALVNPISKYALMVTPIVTGIEKKISSHYNKRTCQVLIRTALVISTVFVAVAVPFFGELMSLVGAFLSVFVSIVFPCLCYLKLSGIYMKNGFERVIIMVIVLMGIVTAVCGTYVAIQQLISHL
ncbi:amino acid transporter AVT1J-like [Impatiens glandulifera]|uniref:amino acid transporter AVT1J-like n=1 Tax=Impatiens glandulifera TaxID=253017 RepID=UPI001FB0A488|nr:amino acid transporter AVT1J-like [Impatiens glandulifera]